MDRNNGNTPFKNTFFEKINKNISLIVAGHSTTYIIAQFYYFDIPYFNQTVCSGYGICVSKNNCTCNDYLISTGEQCKLIVTFRFQILIPLYLLIFILLTLICIMLINYILMFYETFLKRNPFRYHSKSINRELSSEMKYLLREIN